jgi:uroporphyrinogen III methyltransferase/synthase
MPSPTPGKVFLVGAGPGDPGLVTVRGLALIRAADAIFYDNLATPALLAHARPDAETLYVGKKRAAHAYSQEEINRMLVERARAGKSVVRLKGGDPFIFGRGGEEAEALADAGVSFEIVPGVSSALGAAAYAGIPLTHRATTSAVTFVTGHAAESIDWAAMGKADTLVLFMGLTSFAEVARRLIDAGRRPETPAAAIRWATRPDQTTLTGTLADLAARIEAAGLKPPALVIVGEVVGLRSRLDWFERLPLFGKRILITRPKGQSAELAEKLRRLGADPVELPAIEIRPPAGLQPLDDAIAQLETYDWLIFTSRNGVERFVERLDASPQDWRALRAKVCAIGPATASALSDLHLKVDIVPEEYVAEGLLAALEPHGLDGKRILIPRALVARDLLPDTLRVRGAHVEVVAAYETVAPEGAAERARALFSGQAPPPDWVTFTSSSTASNLAKMVGVEPLRRSRAASIGPVTSATLRKLGLEPAAEASEYTVDGLIAAIVASGEE